ncbi:MAG: phosphoadenosine phosphosulfate reductase family protein [Pseudomonadota bacterium]
MTKVLKHNFVNPDAKTKNLVQRLKRFDLADRLELIANTFDGLVLRTRFSLADQVLAHALVSNQIKVKFVADTKSVKAGSDTLRKITIETYGLDFNAGEASKDDTVISSAEFSKEYTDFIGQEAISKQLQVNPIIDWSYQELVDYVLAHEVPVNPADMPGFAEKAA